MKDFGTAVILAGGKSTRMGFDKQLLKVQDKLLNEFVRESLKNEFDDILVVTNKGELYKDADVRICSDEFIGMGPLAGLHTALKHSKSKYAYLIACDMPVICLEYIRYMEQRIQETGAKICLTRKNNWLEPFNAFYAAELYKDLEKRLGAGNTSMFDFITSTNPEVIPEEYASKFDKNLRMFININTGNEYVKYIDSIV